MERPLQNLATCPNKITFNTTRSEADSGEKSYRVPNDSAQSLNVFARIIPLIIY